MLFNKNPRYLIATPASAYRFAQNNLGHWQKDVLIRLFSLPKSPVLNNETLASLFHTSNAAHLEYKFNECIKINLIQAVTKELVIHENHLEKNLKIFIQSLSIKEKALLSDSQGFCIVSHGFTDDVSDEISALSVEINILHQRRAADLCKKLGINSDAWSINDISGKSCLGFWPLNIGEEVFVLAIEGKPNLHNPAMVPLIWMLYTRYGKSKRKYRRRLYTK